MIELTKDYFLDFDKMQFILSEKKTNSQMVKNKITGEPEKGEHFGNVSFEKTFYPRFSQLAARLLELQLRESHAESLKDMDNKLYHFIQVMKPSDAVIQELKDLLCDLQLEVDGLNKTIEKLKAIEPAPSDEE